MNDNINWKERYIELEDQMLDMMKMIQNLMEEEKNHQTAQINRVEVNQIEDNLEVVAISKGNNPLFLFEVLNKKNRLLHRKYTKHKNSLKLNMLLFKEPIKVKISIKNERNDQYVHFYETKLLNEESAI